MIFPISAAEEGSKEGCVSTLGETTTQNATLPHFGCDCLPKKGKMHVAQDKQFGRDFSQDDSALELGAA